MKASKFSPFRAVCLAVVLLGTALELPTRAQTLDQFVLVKGNAAHRDDTPAKKGRPAMRVEDFEMLDHPVSNREYKQFVDVTGHPAPSHWQKGVIPTGKENYPVIFVNREDARAFLKWLSKKDGRCYRLPTTAEFEYAARGGLVGKKYVWGDEEPKGRANFDADEKRPFNRWMDYLQPARSGETNGFGLYGMSGNIWQMTITRPDPATINFKYRIEDTDLLENSIMGGSWARTISYLRCGLVSGQQAGIRYPDCGFRPVREPQGQDWRPLPRRLTAVTQGTNGIFLSWALLTEDQTNLAFHVYRANSREHDGTCVTKEPVRDASTWLDTRVTMDTRYQYYVRSVDEAGKLGRCSEWCGVTASETDSFNVITTFAPLYKQGGLVPIFGDLNGDHTMDCVIRMDNGNTETSQDPGFPVQLEAFTSWGRSLWRKDICYHDHCFGNANNVPFNVWDMDQDGKAEVVTLLQQGDEILLAILDGMTGRVLRSTPWPKLASDFEKSSTRVHLSVVCLDGKNPAVVTQSGLYENEIFTAFDQHLNKLWQFNSFAETSGSGGHKIEAADVDGDGRQEIFDGTTCLNADGTVRWSLYRQHPDIVSIHDYLPSRPGLEVFYIVESPMHAGVYLADANTGEIIWKRNREDDPAWTHGHSGWSADIWEGSPGLECISNRAGHKDNHYLLFAADGTLLKDPFPSGYKPLEWDGDLTRELYKDEGRFIGDFNGQEVVPKSGVIPNRVADSKLVMVADIYGDFRDELVLNVPTAKGGRAIAVVMASEPIPFRYQGAMEDREYRFWIARNMGGGYPSVYDRVLIKK